MRERKETETKKEAKQRKRRAQAPKERLGGSPKFPVRRQVQFFMVLAILEAVRGGFRRHFGSFLGQFWEKRAETESTGPKRAFRRFSEVPSTTKSTVFFRCWLSWRPSGEVSGAFWKLFRAILGSIFGTIERRKQKRRTSLPLEPARAGSTLARSETDEKATQKRLKTRPR